MKTVRCDISPGTCWSLRCVVMPVAFTVTRESWRCLCYRTGVSSFCSMPRSRPLCRLGSVRAMGPRPCCSSVLDLLFAGTSHRLLICLFWFLASKLIAFSLAQVPSYQKKTRSSAPASLQDRRAKTEVDALPNEQSASLSTACWTCRHSD